MEQHSYRYLQSLVNSDFQIVEGEPDIIGWKVKSESSTYLGEVKDLLFDPQTNAVRYLIIDLSDNGMNLDDKKVTIPIGIAHLHTSDDEVVLPNIHIDQFNALPAYGAEEIGPEAEVYIRSVIGSPAALRIEETTVEFDQNQFYAHQHFDKDKFYQRDRSEEQATIHQLIDNSARHDHYSSAPENEPQQVQDGGHPIKPWLEPGASHHQGGDENTKDHEDDVRSNRAL